MAAPIGTLGDIDLPMGENGASGLVSARCYAIPLRTRFRGIAVREGMVIEGPAGWGEFCPFPEYGDVEAVPTPEFYYGMERGADVTVELEPGKALIIKFQKIGRAHV